MSPIPEIEISRRFNNPMLTARDLISLLANEIDRKGAVTYQERMDGGRSTTDARYLSIAPLHEQ